MVSTFDEGALRFRLKTDGLTDVLISNSGEIQPGRWYHVAATYDGSKMRIYKNAMEIASIDKSGNIDTNLSVSAAIGNQPSGAGSRPFDGLVDDFRIYNRALSASEIKNLMNARYVPSISMILSYPIIVVMLVLSRLSGSMRLMLFMAQT